MSLATGKFFEPALLVPSLKAAFEGKTFDPAEALYVAVAVDPESKELKPAIGYNRESVPLFLNETVGIWRVPSLRALYRGAKVPPDLGDGPEPYEDIFTLYDQHLAMFSKSLGPPRDEELAEIFSAIRRRPDGKSTRHLHDFLWQVSALMLGTRELSEAEFAAIVGRQERSCRTFAMGPSSRNFATMLLDLREGR